jgi:hypothetical protein
VPQKKHSTKIPKIMQDYYQKLTRLTDDFCLQYLNDEYKNLACYAVAALCRKKPSPLINGRLNTWACAIIHSLGFVNFLFDKNTKPFISHNDLADAFGLSKSTVRNKSRQVRELLKIYQFDHHWCLPSRLKNSTAVWMISFNGFIVDVRTMPREIQEIAFEKGLIPFLPDGECLETR